jgi:hypothetical protein
MGLRSGGDSFAAARSCSGGAVLEGPLDGGGGTVVTAPLIAGGGGHDHTLDRVSGESQAASLTLVLGARVPMGRPRCDYSSCTSAFFVGIRAPV